MAPRVGNCQDKTQAENLSPCATCTTSGTDVSTTTACDSPATPTAAATATATETAYLFGGNVCLASDGSSADRLVQHDDELNKEQVGDDADNMCHSACFAPLGQVAASGSSDVPSVQSTALSDALCGAQTCCVNQSTTVADVGDAGDVAASRALLDCGAAMSNADLHIRVLTPLEIMRTLPSLVTSENVCSESSHQMVRFCLFLSVCAVV